MSCDDHPKKGREGRLDGEEGDDRVEEYSYGKEEGGESATNWETNKVPQESLYV